MAASSISEKTCDAPEPVSNIEVSDLECAINCNSAGSNEAQGENHEEVLEPEHPQNWSYAYRWATLVLLSVMTLITNVAIPIIAPAVPQLLAELQPGLPSSDFQDTFVMTVWGLGQMSGPLVLGPLSEIWGRAPIYHVSTLLFIVFSVMGALSVSVPMVMGSRFLMAFVAVAPNLNPPIVGDMFCRDERGGAMALVSMAPLFGTVIGPLIGGYVSQSIGWRWVFWVVAIATAAFEVALLCVYHETYYPRILHQSMRGSHHGQQSTEHRGKLPGSKGKHIKVSIIRPLRMLFLSPAVLLVSIYVAMVYAYIYLLAATLTPVLQGIYGLGQGAVGLSYLGIGVGMLVGVLFCGMTIDRYYSAKVKASNGHAEPEFRLMPMVISGVFLPTGLFLYGWAADKALPVIVPILGTAIFAFAVAVCQVVSSTYLVDVFGQHAASAVAASMTARFLASAFVPLAALPMYNRLGLGWGNSVLGFMALALVPAPLFLVRYGKRLRSRGWYHHSHNV